MTSAQLSSYTKPVAQAGLVAKGLVYCLLGVLVLMAVFHIDGKSADKADKSGVLDLIREQTGGQIILGVVAAGLLCYCAWRMIQAIRDTERKGTDAKGILSRLRYAFSGLIYGYFGISALGILFANKKSSGSGDQEQSLARDLLSRPFGQWLVGFGAAILLGIGIYQVWYGVSEKYRKHVENAAGNSHRDLLLGAGKVGYIARGIVWILIAWLFFKAAISSNSSEAGDTSRAFGYLEDVAYGPYLLAAMGLGMICYGAFNFIRARFERFS